MATSMHQGVKSITTTGTAVALASTQEVNWLLVWAPRSNEERISLGSSSVTRTEAANDGIPVIQGAPPIKLGECDLEDVYINGFAADKVYFCAGSTDS